MSSTHSLTKITILAGICAIMPLIGPQFFNLRLPVASAQYNTIEFRYAVTVDGVDSNAINCDDDLTLDSATIRLQASGTSSDGITVERTNGGTWQIGGTITTTQKPYSMSGPIVGSSSYIRCVISTTNCTVNHQGPGDKINFHFLSGGAPTNPCDSSVNELGIDIEGKGRTGSIRGVNVVCVFDPLQPVNPGESPGGHPTSHPGRG